MQNRKIFVVRNVHPEEASAFFLAKKVTEKLNLLGHDAQLFTLPFSETVMGYLLGKASAQFCKQIEVYGTGPSDNVPIHWWAERCNLFHNGIVFSFHNYPVDELDVILSETPSEWWRFGFGGEMLFRNINAVMRYYYQKNSSFRWGGEELSITIELPAVYKPITDPRLKRYRESPKYYKHKPIIVDFIATKKEGLLSGRVINDIVEGITKIKEAFEKLTEIYTVVVAKEYDDELTRFKEKFTNEKLS